MSGQKKRRESGNSVGGRRNLSLPIVEKEKQNREEETHKEKDLSTSVLDDKLIAFFFHNIPSPEKIVFA